VTQDNNGQNPTDLLHTANLLRGARPRLTALRLDEVKRDVMHTQARHGRRIAVPLSLRRRLLGLTLFASLFAISTSTAAAQALNWVSAGTLGKTLGTSGTTKGTTYFFGSYNFGGDHTDDAGQETYCRDDAGSDSSDGNKSRSASKTTVTTHTNTGGGGGDSSDNRCDNGSDSSDEKKGGKDEHKGGQSSEKSGKDDKSSGKSSEKSGKDDKSNGKSSSKGGK
jgi:hypothetical protein